jgi:TRAP transporter TAXI family solute receptor
MARLRLVHLVVIVVAVLGAASCSRGADEARVRSDLQTRLDRDLKPDLFDVVALSREGSAPLPASDSGANRVVVYFNATLKVLQDAAFGGWDNLSPSSVAYVLGANEKGVFGLQGQNHTGDLVRAYGSAIYEQSPAGWTAVAPVPAGGRTSAPELEGPALRSKQLFDRLATLVNVRPPGPSAVQDEIVADELARASRNIERRMERRQQIFTVATGPPDEDYARFGDALLAAVNEVAPRVSLRQRYSEGGVDNARLLSAGEADYGLVQGDVAAAAFAGRDSFAHGGALDTLRAVGALFPEAIHIVVLPTSPIREVSQLRNKRVNLGPPSSGTRFDALAVLDAAGLRTSDLAEARADTLAVAIGELIAGRLDALFTTAPAPTRALQQLAVSPGLRLLSLRGPVVERLVRDRPGLEALTLPTHSYPRQDTDVVTVGSATLLVTTVDAPSDEVGRVSDLLFTRLPQMRERTADVVSVSSASPMRGVTIPLHPGAKQAAAP